MASSAASSSALVEECTRRVLGRQQLTPVAGETLRASAIRAGCLTEACPTDIREATALAPYHHPMLDVLALMFFAHSRSDFSTLRDLTSVFKDTCVEAAEGDASLTSLTLVACMMEVSQGLVVASHVLLHSPRPLSTYLPRLRAQLLSLERLAVKPEVLALPQFASLLSPRIALRRLYMCRSLVMKDGSAEGMLAHERYYTAAYALSSPNSDPAYDSFVRRFVANYTSAQAAEFLHPPPPLRFQLHRAPSVPFAPFAPSVPSAPFAEQRR